MLCGLWNVDADKSASKHGLENRPWKIVSHEQALVFFSFLGLVLLFSSNNMYIYFLWQNIKSYVTLNFDILMNIYIYDQVSMFDQFCRNKSK